MNQSVLNFLCNYLKSTNISFYIADDTNSRLNDFDLGLRNSILKNNAPHTVSSLDDYDPNSLYHFSDYYGCQYSFFHLPDNRMFFVGPYLLRNITDADILQLITNSKIPDSNYQQLRDYYYNLPLIADRGFFWNFLRQAVCDICELEEVNEIPFDLCTLESREEYLKKHQFHTPDDPILSMNLLEKRYKNEDAILEAVAQGNTAKAMTCFAQFGSSVRISPRSQDALRNLKNLTITFNSLLRRTAYTAGVHPFYIDVTSSNFASLIENANTIDEINEITPFMVRNYSELVEKRSTALYSEPIRQILVTIDASITSDLSLKRFANELFLNTSYLSSLFKKETGQTLTEYVNKNRVAYAKRLLKSTTLSIQGVATAVGIPDIHYFTRLFKKETGLSPREYRKK